MQTLASDPAGLHVVYNGVMYTGVGATTQTASSSSGGTVSVIPIVVSICGALLLIVLVVMLVHRRRHRVANVQRDVSLRYTDLGSSVVCLARPSTTSSKSRIKSRSS